MSDSNFDPYYHWLGIPPHEQPANHYRLLGITMFEADPRVIGNAADQRMLLLRSFQIGPNALLTQSLMSHVEAARATLLYPQERAAYDQWLLAQIQGAYAAPPPQVVYSQPPQVAAQPQYQPALAQTEQVVTAAPVADFYQEPAPRPSAASKMRRSRGPSTVSVILQTVIGGLVGIAAAYYVVTEVIPNYRKLNVAHNPRPVQKVVRPNPPPPPAVVPYDNLRPAPQGPPVVPPQRRELIPVPNQDAPPSPIPPSVSNPSVPPTTDGPPRITIKPSPPENSQTGDNQPQQPKITVVPPKALEVGLLPKYIKLPEIAAAESVALFAHGGVPAEQLTLRLLPLAGGALIYLERPTPNVWRVMEKANSTSVAEEVGEFQHTPGHLHFAWKNSQSSATARTQLINYFLQLEQNGKTHQAQLREPVFRKRIVLDLEKEETREEFPLYEGKIDKEKLRIRVKSVESPVATEFKGQKSEAEHSKELLLLWADNPGPQLQMKLLALPDQMRISCKPRFVESASSPPQDWTFENLKKVSEALEKKVESDKDLYNNLKSEIRTVESKIRSVQSDLSSAGSDAARAALNIQINNLQKLRGKMLSKGKALERSVPIDQLKLSAVPKVLDFMKDVHAKVYLEVDIYFAGDGGNEILLASFSEP